VEAAGAGGELERVPVASPWTAEDTDPNTNSPRPYRPFNYSPPMSRHIRGEGYREARDRKREKNHGICEKFEETRVTEK